MVTLPLNAVDGSGVALVCGRERIAPLPAGGIAETCVAIDASSVILFTPVLEKTSSRISPRPGVRMQC